MQELLIWIYLINTTLLITHEIDSAYWKEWELLGFKGGVSFFMLIHIPIVFLALTGLLLITRYESIGLIFAGAVSAAGVIVFIIHMIHIFQGKQEFRTPVSLGILISTFVISLLDGVLLLFIFFS